MRAVIIILGLAAGLTIFPFRSNVSARNDAIHKSESFEAKGAKKIVADISYGAGTLVVTSEAISQAAKAEVSYGSDRTDYDMEYEVKGDVGYLDFKNRSEHISHVDTKNNRLDLTLSTQYPTELKLEAGAAKATVDLGGLRLTDLDLSIGAASGEITFSQPNPERLRVMKIQAGAASVDLSDLGNANFEYFKFDGGAGKFNIDLLGKYTGESRVEMEIGLGKAEIILPSEVPVRIEADDDSWFSSIDLHTRRLERIEKGVYQSPGYDDAKIRIELKLNVGLGSADVRWR
jgi:hypothetical protein